MIAETNRRKLEVLKRRQALHPRVKADAQERLDAIFKLYEEGADLGLITGIEWFAWGGGSHRLTLRIDASA